MIDKDEYSVKFFEDKKGKMPVREFLEGLSLKEHAKVVKYIEFLRVHQGVLDEPYARHIRGKIRELRIDFGRQRHRVLYFLLVGKKIVLLHAFTKRTAKTPESEIKKAEERMQEIINNENI